VCTEQSEISGSRLPALFASAGARCLAKRRIDLATFLDGAFDAAAKKRRDSYEPEKCAAQKEANREDGTKDFHRCESELLA
jgi:hypothetical protein